MCLVIFYLIQVVLAFWWGYVLVALLQSKMGVKQVSYGWIDSTLLSINRRTLKHIQKESPYNLCTDFKIGILTLNKYCIFKTKIFVNLQEVTEMKVKKKTNRWKAGNVCAVFATFTNWSISAFIFVSFLLLKDVKSAVKCNLFQA